MIISLSLNFLVYKVVYGLLPPWLGEVMAVSSGSASMLFLGKAVLVLAPTSLGRLSKAEGFLTWASRAHDWVCTGSPRQPRIFTACGAEGLDLKGRCPGQLRDAQSLRSIGCRQRLCNGGYCHTPWGVCVAVQQWEDSSFQS